MCSESNGTKFWSQSFHLQNSGLFQTKMDQRGVPMKMNFENFQIQKWISQTVRAQKADEKNGVICLVYLFPSWVVILIVAEIVSLLQFCTDVSKKSNPVDTGRKLNVHKTFRRRPGRFWTSYVRSVYVLSL